MTALSLSSSPTVLIFSEEPQYMFELLAGASTLRAVLQTELIALFISGDSSTATEGAQKLITYGADRVYTIIYPEAIEGYYPLEPYVEMLTAVINDCNPQYILIAGTKFGKELAPTLAAKLNAGVVADAFKLEVDAETRKLIVTRLMYGGNGTAKIKINSERGVITIPPRTFEVGEPDDTRQGEITKFEIKLSSKPRVQLIRKGARAVEGVKLEDAEIIVSLGRGVKKREDIKIIEELAQALGGQVGCSRPIAADLKWLSRDHWVGLSGHKVKPKLYIACGISGQIQHLAGMRDSGIIVAINRDPEAPIFKAADYGIVGDLYKIVPALTSAVKKQA